MNKCLPVNVYTCLPYLLDDLCHHIELVELRHDVDAVRPRFELLDQLDSHFHANFRSVFTCSLDALPCLLGDEDARDFVVEEICVPYTDQRQDTRQNRLVELSIFCFVAFEQRRSILGAVNWLGDEKVCASLHLAMQVFDLSFYIRRA